MRIVSAHSKLSFVSDHLHARIRARRVPGPTYPGLIIPRLLGDEKVVSISHQRGFLSLQTISPLSVSLSA